MICHGEMTPIKRGHVRFWHCERCDAHALIHSAMRRVLVPEIWHSVWPEIRRAALRSTRRCPSCQKAMEQSRPLRDGGGIQVDVCDPCDLIWLDPNELAKLPKVPVEENPEVPLELRQAFGKALVAAQNLEYDKREGKLSGAISNSAGSLFWGLIGAFLHRR